MKPRVSPVLVAAWVALALFRASFRWAISPDDLGPLARLIADSLIFAVAWTVCTPPVVRLVRGAAWRRGQRATAAAALAAGAVAFTAIEPGWGMVVARVHPMPVFDSFPVTFLARLDWNLFAYGTIVALTLAADRRAEYRATETRRNEIESRLHRAQLELLLLQLQPHFLFNTLNTISELAHRDAALAAATIRNLRMLLASGFGPGAAEVSLGEEVGALQPYLDIQRLRFGTALALKVDVPSDAAAVPVPRLVLQPLVENAVRHGTLSGGRVRLSARISGDRLTIEVGDDGAGIKPAASDRTGMGLENVRRRLALLYAGAATLGLERSAEGWTIARLVVPLSLPSPLAAAEGEPLAAGGGGSTAVVMLTGWLLAGTGYGLLWLLAQASFLHLAGSDAGPARAGPLLLVANGWLWGAIGAGLVWLVRRGTSRRLPTVLVALAHGVFATVLAAGHLWLFRRAGLSPWEAQAGTGAKGIVVDLLLYATILGAAYAWDFRARTRASDRHVERATATAAQAELDLLRWRLQPGFLDGVMVDLERLVAHDPTGADDLTVRMGVLLRLMLLDRNRELTPLSHGMALLRAWLDVERLRRRLTIVLVEDVGDEAACLVVPPLLLQSMAAGMLGAADQAATVTLALEARREPGLLHLRLVARGLPAIPAGAESSAEVRVSLEDAA